MRCGGACAYILLVGLNIGVLVDMAALLKAGYGPAATCCYCGFIGGFGAAYVEGVKEGAEGLNSCTFVIDANGFDAAKGFVDAAGFVDAVAGAACWVLDWIGAACCCCVWPEGIGITVRGGG